MIGTIKGIFAQIEDVVIDLFAKLLLHTEGDVGNTGHTTMVGGTPILVDEKPISYYTKVNPNKKFGNSAAFNGTNSYLSVPDSSDWDFDTGNFTIDFWVNPVDFSDQMYIDRAQAGGPDTSNVFQIGIYNDDLYFDFRGGGATSDNCDATELTIGAWNHIAVVRNGGNIYMYVNGVQKASAATTLDFDNAYPVNIGRNQYNNTMYFNGYMDEVRISKGVARWTTAFTPETEPYTSDANTQLLLHFSDVDQGETPATVIDSGNTGHTVTNQSSNVSGCGYWWTGSMEFDGNTDYLSVSNHADWDFGSGEFTLEAFVNFNSIPSSSTLFSRWATASKSFLLRHQSTNQLQFYYSTDGTNSFSFNFAWTPLVNIWYHVLISLDSSNNLRAFVNGSQIGSTETLSATIYNTTLPLIIGASNEYVWNLDGYMSEIRISKGVARYTGNFTPRTRPHVSDANTSLLLHSNGNEAHGSTGKHDVTFANAGIQQNTDSPFVGYKGSYEFNGVNDYITLPSSNDWDFEDGSFVIDFWFKATGEGRLIDRWGNGTTTRDWVIDLDGNGEVSFGWSYNGSALAGAIASNATGYDDDAWYYLAIVRTDADDLYMFIDGIRQTSTSNLGANSFFGSSEVLVLASDITGADCFAGSLAEIRISKGTDRGFTGVTIPIPTSPYV